MKYHDGIEACKHIGMGILLVVGTMFAAILISEFLLSLWLGV